MSLYDRLNLNRPSRKLKEPIWERINLRKPILSQCNSCHKDIISTWLVCPFCGSLISSNNKQIHHSICIQVLNINVDTKEGEFILGILPDAFAKVFSAFRDINVFLTTENLTNLKHRKNNFTIVYLFADDCEVDYLGTATFKPGKVTNLALVSLDQIFKASYWANLDLNQLSNLIANTVAHEIGHTLGLDHSDLPTDVMNDGLDYRIHSLMPPSFHAEQIMLMNNAIRNHK